MKKKNIALASVAIIAMIISGCGSSGGGDSTATTVTVERGPVFGATVTDSSTPVKTAVNTAGTNQYVFASTPTYPITVTDGFIDANYDGVITAGVDYPLDLPLVAERGLNITPLTTYIADLNDTEEETLAATIGATVTELTDLPSAATGVIVAAVNSAYAALVTETLNPGTDIEAAFNSSFDLLQSETIVSDNVTSDNITSEDLADIEKNINDTLGLIPLTEDEIEDDNDNTTSDNITE